jgi:peptidoglycan/xylan/chitin deacetylase (PgdA/CDA1 family)
MSASLPPYYTSLGPFRELFQTGLPVLTYHKLGPRPRRVRLKGLYLGAGLLARQLAELRAAGFQTISLDSLSGGAIPATGSIVLTFDDGFRNVFEHGLGLLSEHRCEAIQFLVADQLGKTNQWDEPLGEAPEPLMDAAQVRDWLAAGHTIGSHTCTHPHLARLPADVAREEISASKKKLEDLFGVAVNHFCYPYGDWNPAVREMVGAAGYRTASSTEFGVNTSGADPLALKRITARYRSRSWRDIKRWLMRSGWRTGRS